MRKKILFVFGLFLCNLFCLSVSAESLEISLVNENRESYEFDVVVKDVKNEKTNVITGNVSYDKSLFWEFDIVEVSGWKLYKNVNENNISFVLVNLNGYATEGMSVLNIKTNFFGNDSLNINIGSIESSSISSIINISSVDFKYEIPVEEIVVPEDDLIDNIEVDNENEENNDIVDEETESKDNKSNLEEKGKSSNKKYGSLFVVVLIIIALIVLLFIIFRNKDKKGGK